MNIKGASSNMVRCLNFGNVNRKMSLVNANGSFTSLPDDMAKKIQEMAKNDAEKGIYMGEEFVSCKIQFREDYVSPDRASLIAKLTPMVQNAKYIDGLEHSFSLLDMVTEKIQSWSGKNVGTGKIHVGANGYVTMSICNNHGEEILAYNSFGGGGWTSVPTKAEFQYDKTTTAVYLAAYQAARSEMKERISCQDSGDEVTRRFEMKA